MMRLVLTKEQAIEALMTVHRTLEQAREAAGRSEYAWRLGRGIAQSQELLNEFLRYEEVMDPQGLGCRVDVLDHLHEGPDAVEALVSWAFGQLRGLESCHASGFELPAFLREKVKVLGDDVLALLHEMRAELEEEHDRS
jgi:hypothetical protein